MNDISMLQSEINKNNFPSCFYAICTDRSRKTLIIKKHLTVNLLEYDLFELYLDGACFFLNIRRNNSKDKFENAGQSKVEILHMVLNKILGNVEDEILKSYLESFLGRHISDFVDKYAVKWEIV